MHVPTERSFPQAALHEPAHNLYARQAAVVADLGLTALRNPDVQALFDKAVHAVSQTLEHELCKVLELLPDGKALLLRSGVGWAAGLVGHGTVSAGLESQAGYTLMHGGPLVVPDLPHETRFDGPPLLHNHGVVSGLSTPIYTSAGPWGVLGVHAKRRHAYSEQDVNFLVAVANVLGAAVERQRYEQELHAAKARLEEIDRLRTHFLHNVSHELRTPLTPLVLQLEAVEPAVQELPPSEAAERAVRGLGIARRSARRLSQLVEDLVDVTRLQTGRLDLTLAPLDLAAVVREGVEGYHSYAQSKQVALDVDVAGALPIQGDARRLHQALGNLLSNAVKFTPPGGRVHVAARAQGDFAEVQVRDTGAGFTPEERALLFQPFTQHGSTDRAPESGLGLGLFIVRGIVERHGGQVEAHSPGPGKGATFSFTIRLAKGHRLTERVGA